jgi:DsbC/DsbD-like thiol-disulfide interchange protein
MWRAKHWLKHVCSAAIAAAGWSWGHAAQAAAQKPGFVEVELIAEHTAAVPGKPLWIGLSMKHDPGWHTYWKNPGDAGLPTTLSFTLPGGYRAGAIEWPYPQRIQVKQLASYGYEGTVLLPLLLFVPQDATGTVNLTARADWLVCKESCIPESADVQLSLPVQSAQRPGTQAARFVAARAALPRPVQGASASAVRENGQLMVNLTLPEPLRVQGDLFLDREDVVEPGPQPRVKAGAAGVQWMSALTANGKKLAAPVRLPAVWVPRDAVANQPRAVRVDVLLQR